MRESKSGGGELNASFKVRQDRNGVPSKIKMTAGHRSRFTPVHGKVGHASVKLQRQAGRLPYFVSQKQFHVDDIEPATEFKTDLLELADLLKAEPFM
jgi:hypothetical protein